MTAEVTLNPTITITHEDYSNSTIMINRAVEIAINALNNIKQSGIFLFNQLEKRVIIYPLQPVVREIGILFTRIERVFNCAGSAPWISSLSGPLRILFGQAQVTSGIALILLSEVGKISVQLSQKDSSFVSKWKSLSALGVDLTIHGCLNIIRGTGETLISKYTFGVGNIFLLLVTREDDFAPHFAYGDFAK